MKKVEKFKSVDGRLFDSKQECLVHEQKINEIEAVYNMLHIPNKYKDNMKFVNGDGKIQHTEQEVLSYKKTVIELVFKYNDFIREEFEKYSIEEINSRGIFGRYIDDCAYDFKSLWWRLMCINSKHQEFGQPYFAIESEK